MKRLIVPLLTLTLFGFGCAPIQPVSPVTPNPALVGQPIPHIPTSEELKEQAAQPRVLTPFVTDSTWKTYSNAQLGFSFKYPTKGTYIPSFAVKTFNPNDPDIKNQHKAVVNTGCLWYPLFEGQVHDLGQRTNVIVGKNSFCITTSNSDTQKLVEGYTTIVNGMYASIIFTIDPVVFDRRIEFCDGKSKIYNPSGDDVPPPINNGCMYPGEFYEQTLDSIISTFKLK